MQIRNFDLADTDAAFDIRTRSFGPINDSQQASWLRMTEPAVADGRVLGVYDGSRLAAMARINRYTQWWCGREMPMAGIGGVVVAPEDRGRGIGRTLMAAVLERAADLGYPISALYPATTPVYRSLGWEHAGARYAVTVPTEALRTISAAPVKLRRVGPDDAAEVLATMAAAHAAHRDRGPIMYEEAATRDWLSDARVFGYLADDGFVAYRWDGPDTLCVEHLAARSASTARALWALVGSGSSIAATVRAFVAPDDPIRWLTREAVVKADADRRWMLRVIDAPAAVASRGFPLGVAVDAVLTVADPQRSGNAGTWRLVVAGGRGELTRAAEVPMALRLGAGGLAALFAGTSTATLRRAGLAEGGDPAVDALLDAAFAGQAFMLDYF